MGDFSSFGFSTFWHETQQLGRQKNLSAYLHYIITESKIFFVLWKILGQTGSIDDHTL